MDLSGILESNNNYHLLSERNPLEELKTLLLQNSAEISTFLLQIEQSLHLNTIRSLDEIREKKEEVQILIRFKKALHRVRGIENVNNDNNSDKNSNYNDHSMDYDSDVDISTMKLAAFKDNIQFTLGRIQWKLGIIQKEAEQSTNLSYLIVYGKVLREMKKIMESFKQADLGRPTLVILRTERKLYIKVAEAKELKSADIIRSTSDSYAIVSVNGEKKFRTPTKFKELNPVWLQEYSLEIPTASATIEVSVWGEGLLANDTFLGHVMIPVMTLQEQKFTEQWFHLLPQARKHDVAGSIHLKFSLFATRNMLEIKSL